MSQAIDGTPMKVAQLRDTLMAVRRHATAVWWCSTLLGVLGAACIAVIVAVFLDQMLGGLPAMIRLLLLLGVIAAPIVVLRNALRSKPGGSPEELALLVEKRYPDLDNVLINTLQLAKEDGTNEDIVAAVADEAKSRIATIRPSAAIGKKALGIAGGAAALGLVAFGIYAAVNAEALRTGLNRVFAPLGHNSLTRIDNVTPGDSDVLVGSEVTIQASLTGRIPSQGKLYCTYEDGRTITMPMTPASPAVPDRLLARIDRIEQTATYSVEAGDDSSHTFTLTVHQPPAVQKVTQSVTPPEYIGGKAVEQAGGAVTAVSGSKVDLKFESTEPLSSGKVVLPDGKETALAVLAPTGGATKSLTGTVAFNVTQSGRYRVELTSAAGFTGEATAYDVTALEDKPPVIEIAQPAGETSVPLDAKVVVEVRGRDDYALKEVKLVRIEPADSESGATAKETQLQSWTMKERTEAKTTQQFTLSVASLNLSESKPIMLQAVGYDHKPGGAAGASGIVTIRLKGAGGEEEKAAQIAKISLDALIAKQRANLAASQEIAKSDPKAEAKAAEKVSGLVGRQEEIRSDALAIIAATAPPAPKKAAPAGGATTKPAEEDSSPEGVRRKLINLSDTLMVVAIEQLRTAGSQADPRKGLTPAIDTQQAILSALVVASVRQDAELAERQQRQISELLAQIIAKQQALKGETNEFKDSPEALAARQKGLGNEVSRLAKLIKNQADTGAGGNPELAEQYEKIAAEFGKRDVRGKMFIAAESIVAKAKDAAIKKQEEAIKDLLAIQKMLASPALAEAKEDVKDASEGIRQAKKKVDKLEQLQQKITEIAKALNKTKDLSEGGETSTDEKLRELVEARKDVEDVLEQLVKDMHLLPDMSASNDLLTEISEVYENVKQAKGSENAPASELAVDRDEGTLAALKAMQKKMGERIGDLEMWLADKPDTTAWKQESWDKHEIGKIPLGDLQDQLEDIIGDLLDQQEDISKKAEDSVSNTGLPDGEMGWDIADGPMPSWAAKGKSGNDKPNSMEQTGRSGSGRQGKSSGEIVGDTVKNLKGAEVEARRTNDGFQAGELKEEEGGEKMDVKATGGGKLAGTSDNEGMSGDAPPRNELKYRDMARQQRELKRDAETVYSKARLLKLPTGELDKAILEMDAATRRLDSGDAEGFAQAQDKVVRALRQTKAQIEGKTLVEGVSVASRDQKIAGATNEPVPKQYEDSVAEYMKKIAQEK